MSRLSGLFRTLATQTGLRYKHTNSKQLSNPELHSYILSHTREPEVLKILRTATAEFAPHRAHIMVTPDQGNFLTWLVGTLGVKRAVEVGVFTGYSSTAIALALPADGKLIALEADSEPLELAKKVWERAGVDSKIELRLAPAAVSLASLIKEEAGTFDFVFIDADKAGYDSYYEAGLQLVRQGGVVIIDNVLWYGKVADKSDTTAVTLTLKALNDKILADSRVSMSLVSIGDGLMLCRRLC